MHQKLNSILYKTHRPSWPDHLHCHLSIHVKAAFCNRPITSDTRKVIDETRDEFVPEMAYGIMQIIIGLLTLWQQHRIEQAHGRLDCMCGFVVLLLTKTCTERRRDLGNNKTIPLEGR
jgi:hypothetical protein